MTFDPDKHHRHSIHLHGYDYAQTEAYFVTACAYEQTCLFGEVSRGEMAVNDFGRILKACWLEIPAHFPNVAVEAFVVMPNHIHDVIIHSVIVTDRSAEVAHTETSHVGARRASPLPPPASRIPNLQRWG